ncbi:hypothetical protein [Actinacidiphila cocklensis]|uniref:Uncharacterized protein n=1 Tax=Actinacidiphila cocklensis TaxID=887465 RepID=A0A9W4DMN0_9ACTN|nr:hypothetical protein [Actinacidiphila cocklensis]CAG6392779.1 hypothetical protein SCOCK_180156 [Actinacidiphila cocklensis]
MTRAEMLARISSAELTEWMALYRIEDEERQAAEQDPADAP